jgi:transposase
VRLKDINAKIRLIQHRGYGYANIDNLTAMILLCLASTTITLSTAAS